MAKIKIPQNTGRVRLAMGMGGKFTVWNGKQGENEFKLYCRDRKHAEELIALINSRKHNGEIDVHG